MDGDSVVEVDGLVEPSEFGVAPPFDLAFEVVHPAGRQRSPADSFGLGGAVVEVDGDLVAPFDAGAARHMGDEAWSAVVEQHGDLFGEIHLEMGAARSTERVHRQRTVHAVPDLRRHHPVGFIAGECHDELLKRPYRPGGGRAVQAIDGSGVESEIGEPLLHDADLGVDHAWGEIVVQRRRG